MSFDSIISAVSNNIGPIASAAASLGGAAIQANAASDAAQAATGAAQQGIAAQTAAKQAAADLNRPFVDLGVQAAEGVGNFLADPSQQIEEINPVLSFLREQGFTEIQESAAARGRLGAGGTLKDLTEFNSQLAGTLVPQLQNQRFNQLFNTAGLGANAAAGQGTAALNTASNIGNLLSQSGQAQAGGIIGGSNALTGGIQNLAGTFGAFPSLFGGSGGSGVSSGNTGNTAAGNQLSEGFSGAF